MAKLCDTITGSAGNFHPLGSSTYMVLPERNRPMVVNVNVADEFSAGVAISALQACVAVLGAESGMIGFMDIVAGAVILFPYASKAWIEPDDADRCEGGVCTFKISKAT